MPRIIDNLIHFNGKNDEVSYNTNRIRCLYSPLIHRILQQVNGYEYKETYLIRFLILLMLTSCLFSFLSSISFSFFTD